MRLILNYTKYLSIYKRFNSRALKSLSVRRIILENGKAMTVIRYYVFFVTLKFETGSKVYIYKIKDNIILHDDDKLFTV